MLSTRETLGMSGVFHVNPDRRDVGQNDILACR